MCIIPHIVLMNTFKYSVCFCVNVVVPRNYDATLHPLQAPREYVRAVNSVKLERVFAKPFLGSLDGHRDGISVLCKHPQRLSVMLSGACDGEVSLGTSFRLYCSDVAGFTLMANAKLCCRIIVYIVM